MKRAALVVVGLALVSAGCSLKTTEVNHAVSSPGHSASATTQPVAHVGATLSLDSGDEEVTLNQVIDPAQPANQFLTPSAGDRFVAALFTVKNTSKQAGEGDADDNASVIGSNDQSYTAAFDTVSECTDFDNGEIELGPGESVTGCVTFQLPTGVSVSKVQWSPNAGFAGDFGEWLVP